ncbi:MAG: hypothetical protein KatS3mg121_1337 [Gammaproteobacteria bacterium]|nr:MAG: hypothetical protein KatS3mg121_1337 [Gammaproteobacteria bacterium]
MLDERRSVAARFIQILDATRAADFLAPLLFRVYLAPIFILAGWNKLQHLEATASWFGQHLGLPMPALMAVLAGGTEFVGGLALLLGLGVRVVAVPLMAVMAVAAVTAHWRYGWHALPESTLTVPWEWRPDLIEAAQERLAAARRILKAHGDYAWLTEAGRFTVLKNGVEFAATYFLMLLSLFFTGGGRWVSLDDWIRKSFENKRLV